MASKREAWLSLLPADPRPALLASEEPFARFTTLTAVLGKPADDTEVRNVRKAVVADSRVRALVDRLPDWESGFTTRPGFRPTSYGFFTAWAFARATSPSSSAFSTRCPVIRPTTGAS